jgi:hypothetical protein
MQLVKGKPPETQYATRPGARAKRREVALDRPGFEPGRIRAWLSFRAWSPICFFFLRHLKAKARLGSRGIREE